MDSLSQKTLYERALEALVDQLDARVRLLEADRDAFCEAHSREEAKNLDLTRRVLELEAGAAPDPLGKSGRSPV